MAATVYSNKYEIQEEIAQGGMGIVYKAWDRMLERVVALKVIHQHLAKDSSFLARFLDEARKMALLHHPNIIQIYSVEKDQDIPFLVMEYFPGGNLKTHLRRDEPLGLRESVHIVSQIAHALAFTHKKGIIHRDIKPANILLDNTLTVKLTDFGIARTLDQTTHTVTGQLMGTVKYMSPEQALGIPLDGRSDLYSLGMLFYELVTGDNPRNDLTAVVVLSTLITEGHMPSLNFPARLNIPDEIQQIIVDLLQYLPTDRTPNAETLIERLEQSIDQTSTSVSSLEVEKTDETMTVNVGHSLHNLTNEPTAFQSSDSLSPVENSLSQSTHEASALDHKVSGTSRHNLPAVQPKQTSNSGSSSQAFLSSRSGLLIISISLILAIGGYVWNNWSTQTALLKDEPIATMPSKKNFKEERSTLVLSDSKSQPQQEQKIPSEEQDVPIQKPGNALPSPNPKLEKVAAVPTQPSLWTDNVSEDVSPSKPIEVQALQATSPQGAQPTPSPSSELPVDPRSKIPESPEAPVPHIEASSPGEVAAKESPTSEHVSIAHLDPSEDSPSDLSRSDVPTQKPTEDVSSSPPLIAEATQATSPQETQPTPSASSGLSVDPSPEAVESQIDPSLPVEAAPQGVIEVSPASEHVSIAPIDSSTELPPASSQPSLPADKLTEEVSSSNPIVAGGIPATSPQVSQLTPSSSGELPFDSLAEVVESQVAPSPHIEDPTLGEIAAEESPTSEHASLAPIDPSAELPLSDVLPIVPTKPVQPIDNIEEDQGSTTVEVTTSLETMSSTLHSQVEQLQVAIMDKNWEVLERISSMSESRRFWLETLYKKYQSVQIDIAKVTAEADEGIAVIHFTKGIRSNGEIVIPNKIGRTIKVTILKDGDQWGRIVW